MPRGPEPYALSPLEERDTRIGEIACSAIDTLRAHTAVVYLLEESGRDLRPAVIGGFPPTVHTMPDRIRASDPFATAAAFRTGEFVEAENLDPARLVDPRMALRINFPYSVGCVPIEGNGRRLGVLSLTWVPSRVQSLAPDDRDWLLEAGMRMGAVLEDRGAAGVPVSAGAKPSVIPVTRAFSADEPGLVSPGWGLPQIPGSSGLTFMYTVIKLAAALNQAVTPQEVASAAQWRIVPVFGADALLMGYEADDRIWLVGHSGYSQDTVRGLHGAKADPLTPAGHVLRSGGTRYFEDRAALTAVHPQAPEDGMEACAWIPLLAEGVPVAFCALAYRHRRAFSSDEQAVLAMMAHLLGPALARAQLGERERELAESLQKKLLPRAPSPVPEVLTAARYLPAWGSARLGGDWYDVIDLHDGRVGLLIGDVEGHSVDSAVVMGQLRSAVRAYASEGHPPGSVLERAGRLLEQLDTDLMATCCFVLLDTVDGIAEIVVAGHPPPVIRAPGGELAVPDIPPNVPLGAGLEGGHQSVEISLAPGSLVLLYTDGLVERDGADPVTGALTLLREAGPAPGDRPDDIADRLVTRIAKSKTRHDDAALLLARYEGSGRAAHRQVAHLVIQRHDLGAVRVARHFVHEQLKEWGLDSASEAFQLMTSEVVTNALIHADSDVDLQLRGFPGHVRLDVRDTGSAPPVPAAIIQSDEEASTHAEHGRGLIIVESLASQWGSSPSGRGKTVWFEIAT